jgi:hypothetical protein
VPVGDESRADAQGTLFFAANGSRHRLIHSDYFGGGDKFDAFVTLSAPSATPQLGFNLFRLPDEYNFDAQIARGGKRTVNLHVRRTVAAHRINDDLAG